MMKLSKSVVEGSEFDRDGCGRDRGALIWGDHGGESNRT